MRRSLGLALSLALCLPGMTAARVGAEQVGAEIVALSGAVRSADTGQPVAGVAVTVDGVTAITDADGRFAIEARDAPRFTIGLAGEGYYDTEHSFARHELASAVGRLEIPPIALVERRANRQLLVFGGDVMGGRRYEAPLEGERRLVHDETREADMRALLAVMAPTLRAADLASVNLEITLSARELTTAAPKSYVFYAHPELAQTLAWAGVDYAAQGNNHVYDYLDEGLADTLAAVKVAGLGHSGAGRDHASAIAPWRTRIGGEDWSFLSFVGWEGRVTPNQVAEPGKGGAALGKDATIAAGVAAESAAGRSVVMQYHGSREYSPTPTGETRRRMLAAIDAGADIAIGHHPHVLQGFELHRGKLVAYSLGNFLFDQYIHETQASMLLKVWMDDGDFARAEIVPIDVRDYRPVPAVAGMRHAVLRRLRALSAERLAIGEMAGHGVIAPAGARAAPTPHVATLVARPGELAVAIPYETWRMGWPSIARDGGGRSLRFGRSLMWRGGFESHRGFGAADRTWTFEGAEAALDRRARSGDFALRVTPTGRRTTMTQRVAFRDLARAPITVRGALKGEGARLALQYRFRLRDENSFTDWRDAGRIVADGQGWSAFAFDIPAPAADPTRFNIRLVVEGDAGKARPFLVDDLAVIVWEPADAAARAMPGFRSYVRLRERTAGPQSIAVTFEDWGAAARE